MYREGVEYTFQTNPTSPTVNYVRNIVEKYQNKNPRNIISISKANPAVVTTTGSHNLTTDDIIKLAMDGTNNNALNLTGMSQLDTGYYRVRVLSPEKHNMHCVHNTYL